MQVHHKFEISFVYSSAGKEKNLLFVVLKPFQNLLCVDFPAIKHAAGLSVSRKRGCELTAVNRQFQTDERPLKMKMRLAETCFYKSKSFRSSPHPQRLK